MLRIFVATADINGATRILPEGAEVEYTEGAFHVQYNIGPGSVEAWAVPSMPGGDLLISLPFSGIRASFIGGLAGFVTKLAWGKIREKIEEQAARALRKQGLPTDTVEVGQTYDDDGRQVGLIRIRFDRINAWIDKKVGRIPLVVEVRKIEFTSEGIAVNIEASPLIGKPPQAQPTAQLAGAG